MILWHGSLGASSWHGHKLSRLRLGESRLSGGERLGREATETGIEVLVLLDTPQNS